MLKRYVFASLLLLILTGCKIKNHHLQQIPPTIPVVGVSVIDISVVKSFVGQTYGSSDITIAARVNGFLNGIYFKEGSWVKKGQLLYVIEQAPLEAQSSQAYASLTSARASLVQAQSNYDRISPLSAMDAVSKSELDGAVAELSSAKAAVNSAEASLAYANIQLSYAKIHSPINGVIGATKAKVGDYVGLSSQIPVLNTVSQIDSVLVKFFIPDDLYMEFYQRGGNIMDNITMVLGDGSEYKYKGCFNFVGRAVEQGTGSIDAQVSFQNPDSLLRPGQFAKIVATMGVIKNALLIPQRCVTQTQGIYAVYVVDSSNIVSQKIIEPGETYGEMWSITEGLTSGDRVVYDGFHKIHSDMEIKPVMQKQTTHQK